MPYTTAQINDELSLVDEKGMIWSLPDLPTQTFKFPAEATIKTRSGLLYVISSGVARLEDIPQKDAPSQSILGFTSGLAILDEETTLVPHTECVITWYYWTQITGVTIKIVNAALREELLVQLGLLKVLHGDSQQVLMNLLVYLAERFGQRVDDEYVLLPWVLTHEQIGKIMNTTRVTITRMFKELKNSGQVRISDNLIEVGIPKG